MARGSRLRLAGALAATAALAWSCGGASGPAVDGPLVELGDWSAGAADLVAYRGKLPASLQPAGTDEEVVRSLLSSLVDRRIMIVEGERLGYNEDPEFVDRQARLLSKRLVEMVSQRDVGANVQVSDAEVENLYRTYHWDREVLPAHILSKTREDAAEIISLLDQGRDFGELARERSVAPDADKGGFLGQYFGPDQAIPELVEAAHGLPIGSYTPEPVRTPDGWEVVKVLDATAVPLDQVRPQLTRGIYLGKFVDERRGFVNDLKTKFGARFHADGVAAVVDAANAGEEVDGAATALPVITFGDGKVLTVGDVQRFAVQNARLKGNADSTRVAETLTSRVLADSLLLLEARATGLDTTAEYRDYRDNLYRRMLVTFLRKRQVLDHIEITDEDVRQEYEDGKATFLKPDQVNAREVLVATREEAEDVIARLHAGEDAAALARAVSLRPGAVRTEGHIHIGAADADRWNGHFDEVWNVKPGDVVGPLEMPDGFLVLAIQAVEKGKLRTFEEMRLGLTHRLKLTRQYHEFEAYIDSLRKQYADQVVWHDDRIAAFAAHLPWAGSPAGDAAAP